jgi:hypothetical protein
MPALLKGLIHGPNGRPISPSHTHRRGRTYRYYVTREWGSKSNDGTRFAMTE